MLEGVVLGLAVAMPFSSVAASGISGLGLSVTGSDIAACLALIAVGIQAVAMVIGRRSEELNTLSRTALAWVLPAEAFGVDASGHHYHQLLGRTSPDITSDDIDEVANEPRSKARFETWWATTRDEGEGRLRAMLLENLFWTVEILSATEVRMNRRRILIPTLCLLAILVGVFLAPMGTRSVSEVLLPPGLTFLFAVGGSGLLRDQRAPLHALNSLRTTLRGSDQWASENEAAAWSLLTEYLALTAHLPPLPTNAYQKQAEQLNKQITDKFLEAWLRGQID